MNPVLNLGSHQIDKINGPLGEPGSIEQLLACPVIVGLVAGKWCPHSQKFIPDLLKFYTSCNEKEKRLEIIYMSLDSHEKEYQEVVKTYPWYSIPFESNGTMRQYLSDFDITQCPSLILLRKEDGQIIKTDCRGDVVKNTPIALHNWVKCIIDNIPENAPNRDSLNTLFKNTEPKKEEPPVEKPHASPDKVSPNKGKK